MNEVERRPINGFPGYFVSDDGRVWSGRDARGQPRADLKTLAIYRRPYGNRYCVVCLRDGPCGKIHCHYVHRLVLEAFVGPCPEGMQACHNDGDTSNNRLSNLRWDTHKGNETDKVGHDTLAYGSRNSLAKRTELDMLTIFLLRRQGFTGAAIGTALGMRTEAVNEILQGRKWRHVRRLYAAVRQMAKAFSAEPRLSRKPSSPHKG